MNFTFQKINTGLQKIGRVYSSEQTEIPNMFFTPESLTSIISFSETSVNF
jgi:hypothetical protein